MTMFISSYTQSVTRNWYDSERQKYFHRVVDGRLQEKIGDGEWSLVERRINDWFALDNRRDPPGTLIAKIKNVASDNNRVVILTEDNKLYWRCFHSDAGAWVLVLMRLAGAAGLDDDVARYLREEQPVLFDALEEIIQAEGELKDQIWSLMEERGMDSIEGVSYSMSHWGDVYRGCVEAVHNPNRGWNPLQYRTGLQPEDEIIDVAVGNWNGTVITYYALVRTRSTESVNIWYIDEEAITPEWQLVPGQPSVERAGQAGLKLDPDGDYMLCASHSVIAVADRHSRLEDGKKTKIHWIRCDAHTNKHIPFWPINWTEAYCDDTPIPPGPEELVGAGPPYDMDMLGSFILTEFGMEAYDRRNFPGWHTVEVDVKYIDEFYLNVGYGTRPWPVPKPHESSLTPPLFDHLFAGVWRLYWAICLVSWAYEQVRGLPHTQVGALGVDPLDPNSDYPVCCVIRGDHKYLGFTIWRSTDADITPVNWRPIDEDATTSSLFCSRVDENVEECKRTVRVYREGCDALLCPGLPRFLQGPCRLAAWLCSLMFTVVENYVCPAAELLGGEKRCDKCWREPGKRGGPGDENPKR